MPVFWAGAGNCVRGVVFFVQKSDAFLPCGLQLLSRVLPGPELSPAQARWCSQYRRGRRGRSVSRFRSPPSTPAAGPCRSWPVPAGDHSRMKSRCSYLDRDMQGTDTLILRYSMPVFKLSHLDAVANERPAANRGTLLSVEPRSNYCGNIPLLDTRNIHYLQDRNANSSKCHCNHTTVKVAASDDGADVPSWGTN